jgi:hypothetical protein
MDLQHVSGPISPNRVLRLGALHIDEDLLDDAVCFLVVQGGLAVFGDFERLSLWLLGHSGFLLWVLLLSALNATQRFGNNYEEKADVALLLHHFLVLC